jgi:hypothetical protein
VASGLAEDDLAVVAVRAAYAALGLGIAGGIWLATTVLSTGVDRPVTVAEALGVEPAGPALDRRRAEATAALAASCMADRGLRWTPVVEPLPAVPDPDLGPIEWAGRWGFGASTMVGRPAAVTTADPNLVAIAGLPAVERAAYLRALHGGGWAPGCLTAASETVYGLRDRLLAAVKSDLQALDARIAADPAAARALAAWRICVGPLAPGLTPDRRTLSGALLERFVGRTAAIGAGIAGLIGLTALQADERRVATAVARCELAFIEDRSRVASAHEAAFVGRHREALASIGAAIRAAEAALPTLPP